MSDNKWSELLQGGADAASVKSAVPVASAADGAAFGSWAILLPIAIVAIIAVVVASTGSAAAKTPAIKTVEAMKAADQAALTVVQATAVPDYAAPAPIADARGAPVGVRNTARALFTYEDADLAGVEKPFANNESGFSYTDFQRAMQLGREMPVLDRPVPSNAKTLSTHAASVKAFVERNGMTLESFAEDRDSYLPETIAESWDYQAPVPRAAAPETTEDSLMLARDAMQAVPTSVTEAAIVPVLREILAARTEAASAGIALPAVTEDQEASLKHWATSRSITASSLASSILSRSA